MSHTLSALHQQGQQLYHKGDFRAAIQVFSEVLASIVLPDMAR